MTTDVRPAVGRFAGFAAVVGTKRPGAGGCRGFTRAAPTTDHSGGRPRWIMRRELG